MQSPPVGQLSNLHSRSYRSQPLVTNTTPSTASSPHSSGSYSPPPSNTSTLHSDDLPEHKATNSSQRQHHTYTERTSSLRSSQRQEPLSVSKSSQSGPPRKRRKTSLCRSSSLDRGSTIYRHWTTKSFKPSLAIDVQTNPDCIALLWQLVMMGPSEHNLRSERGKKQSRGKNSRGGSAGVGNPPASGKSQGSVSGQTYPSSSTRPPSTGINKPGKTSETSSKRNAPSNADSKRNSPYNTDFMDNVLEPRSIRIFDRRQFPDTAYAHFGIKVPETRRVAAVDPTKMLPESNIWIDTSDTFVKRVTKRYADMLSRNLCEAEYATYAKEKLLKRDDFVDDEETNAREWRAERWVELVAKPEPKDTWVAPPIIGSPESANLTPSSEYSFDVRPDCSYWLSLKAFRQEYRSYVHHLIHTIHKKFVSPYLTIDFKRDLDAEVVVKNQVAAASALALYNRFRLREQRLEVAQRPWSEEDATMNIRHYGLTMQGSQYEVWCMTPTLSDDRRWAGCEMRLVGYGHCEEPYDVRELIKWINEIHYWGLTIHGPACQNDAKEMLSKMNTGFRPSDIGLEG